MAIERSEPSFTAGDREMLEGWLDYHRATLLLKCEGLTDEQLRSRPVPPSTLSLLGLVRHMAEVEFGWFNNALAGDTAPPIYGTDDNPDRDFEDVDVADVGEAFARLEQEVTRSRAISATRDLDLATARPRDGQALTLRWVLPHMIEEYARHNGHADLLREAIDGTTGD
jgi:uncharacterized damage-inducible protein DinB